MGQATNSLSLRISVRMAGHTTTKIKPLEKEKAVAAGGELLAEGLIYALGAGLMVWEYMSSAVEKERKDAVSKLKKLEEQRELAEALEIINQRLATLEKAVVAAAAEAAAANRANLIVTRHEPSISVAAYQDAGPKGAGGQPSRLSRWRWSNFLGGRGGNQSEPPLEDGITQGTQGEGSSGNDLDSVSFAASRSAFGVSSRTRFDEGAEGPRDKERVDDRGSSSRIVGDGANFANPRPKEH